MTQAHSRVAFLLTAFILASASPALAAEKILYTCALVKGETTDHRAVTWMEAVVTAEIDENGKRTDKSIYVSADYFLEDAGENDYPRSFFTSGRPFKLFPGTSFIVYDRAPFIGEEPTKHYFSLNPRTLTAILKIKRWEGYVKFGKPDYSLKARLKCEKTSD